MEKPEAGSAWAAAQVETGPLAGWKLIDLLSPFPRRQ